ncbi:MAG: hypothetical protein IPP71_06760 [Bacteroidetes bacterium]|nr:hypothetical protein [Bacteroidota bacterium]
MKSLYKLLLVALVVFSASSAKAQINLPFEIHGNFQLDAQYYLEDSVIGAPVVPEKILSNGFGNLTFTRGNFNAGIRYESYQNPLLGFDTRYKGSGITYRYATYTVENLEVTLGNFYEQFGSGLIFRSYEERGLGIDNAMDGIRLKYNPWNGVYLKGFIAQQRTYFDKAGLVRGFDGDFALMDAFKALEKSKTKITVGGGVISKYQEDKNDLYKLPENVLAFATRMRLTNGNFSFYTEYAYKYNDPSLVNSTAAYPKGIYKEGQALYLNAGYAKKGLGVSLSAKYIDNMGFRSDRDATGNDLNLSFLPALTKQQTYRLATLYPYATQPNGEVGFQGEVFYNFKKGSVLGGETGTNVSFNYSRANGLDTINTNDEMGYESKFFGIGEVKYFEEVNIEVQKKLNKNLKLIVSYIYTLYDKGVIQGLGENFGTIYSNIGIVEIQYKINKTNSVRVELQHLYTKQDKQSWAMALVEYSVSPHWFFAVFDEYNYGNDKENERIHYPNASFGYTRGSNRISMGYGKQREGLLCVGGVCRNVPASNGFSISVTSSF